MIRPLYGLDLKDLSPEIHPGQNEDEGQRRNPALRILNHLRTSVSLHCTDFIDYFTAGNIVNLFIPYRRPRGWYHYVVALLGAQ